MPNIAAHRGIIEDEVLGGLEGARAYQATSLSIPVSAERELSVRYGSPCVRCR